MIHFKLDRQNDPSDRPVAFWLQVDQDGDLVLLSRQVGKDGKPDGDIEEILFIDGETGHLGRFLIDNNDDVPDWMAIESVTGGYAIEVLDF